MRALLVAFIITLGQSAFAAEPSKKESPQPLPEDIVKAWTDAGATVGWMKYDPDIGLVFKEKAEDGAVPAFKFAKWKDGVVPKLPVPKAAFGLYLSKTEIQDTGLKELQPLKTLSSLCLCETEVSFDAVDAFQKLLPKCFIFHC